MWRILAGLMTAALAVGAILYFHLNWVLICIGMIAISGIITNILYMNMRTIAISKGHEIIGRQVIRHFEKVIEDEPDEDKRSRYKLLLRRYNISEMMVLGSMALLGLMMVVTVFFQVLMRH